jgi:hypothetical protein
MPAWSFSVKRGDTVVLESSNASALCTALHHGGAGGIMPVAEQQAEIVRRIAFYLAWREVGLS